MNITNKYFIVEYPVNPNFIPLVVERGDTVRVNTFETKCIIKLPYNVQAIPDLLQDIPWYNHSQILVELNKLEWTSGSLAEII